MCTSHDDYYCTFSLCVLNSHNDYFQCTFTEQPQTENCALREKGFLLLFFIVVY